MEKEIIKADKYTASDGHTFINYALKSSRKVLIVPEGKDVFSAKKLAFGLVDQWIEVSYKESCEIDFEWKKKDYLSFKAIYGDLYT